MKTLCLLGSPRRDGNSDTLAGAFMREAAGHGSSCETVALSGLNYNGCQNLFRCKTDLNHCGQKDELSAVLESAAAAQVLVLASPVYFTSISGQLKLALDRFFSFFVPDYPNAEVKTRLSPGRHLVFVQTQGEPENRYRDLMESFSASFTGLGYKHHHLIRAANVREPGDIALNAPANKQCEAVARQNYA